MSAGADGYAAIYREERRRSRKKRVCCACDETIRAGDVYGRTASLYDGAWMTWTRCLRCDVIYQHLCDVLGRGLDSAPCQELNCGHDYLDVHDELPPAHIEALAFWRPGDPIPAEEASR